MKWPVSLSKVPPGEWRYSQNGVTWGPSPLYMQVASQMADFRKGNNLERSDIRSCVMDLIVFTVSRIPQNSDFLTDVDGTPDTLTPSFSTGGCAGCGASVS